MGERPVTGRQDSAISQVDALIVEPGDLDPFSINQPSGIGLEEEFVVMEYVFCIPTPSSLP